MSSPIVYLSFDDLAAIHEIVLENSSGRSGFLNIGLLESCLEHIQNDDYYPTFADKLTHLVYSIAKNHAFADGNKRTAIAAGVAFLTINDFSDPVARGFTRIMEPTVLALVENQIPKTALCEIITDILSR